MRDRTVVGKRAWIVVTGLALLASLVTLPSSAEAAFPGQNGKIVFGAPEPHPSLRSLHTIDPDGSGESVLFDLPDFEYSPAWSPDGTRVAFIYARNADSDIYVVNADGTGATSLGTTEDPDNPAWSADGTKIAYHASRFSCVGGHFCFTEELGIRTINADGSGDVQLLPAGDAPPYNPAWSPDGTKIAVDVETGTASADIYVFNANGTGGTRLTNGEPGTLPGSVEPNWSPDGQEIAFQRNGDIWVMNADGSGPVRITDTGGPAVNDTDPAWSPDGTRIAFLRNDDPHVMDSDGTGVARLTDGGAGSDPDWQPIPVNSYPRPKAATPFRASLTIAYEACASPDREHGPPLNSASCSAPKLTSNHLTVGTRDSNSLPARNEGHLLMRVVPGVPSTSADEADVRLEFFLDDVFTTAFADYTGELRARVPLRITDKLNTPNPGGSGAATTVEVPFELVVGCTPVADPREGSSCTATTTADALAPGTVREIRRSIWALGKVEVYDGGPDGDAHTPAGDTLFATQGLFVP